MSEGYSPTPWAYYLIRLLFKFVLKIFYGTIVVENAHLIPPDGHPCIVCANHVNSLTDAVLLVGSVPSSRRNLLRLTAKATQFGQRTFSSRLIEAAGTVPLKRRKDSPDSDVDNSQVFDGLKQVLEKGDAVCLFPEGFSRYHPTIAPLKTGVARIVSDVLTRQKDNPAFKLSVLTCSITYMHRQHFRSDVLITFHPPITLTPSSHPELIFPQSFTPIRTLTSRIHTSLASGTLSAPSWELITLAKLAANVYAPLGTGMSLGDYVRVSRAFLEGFKWAQRQENGKEGEEGNGDGAAVVDGNGIGGGGGHGYATTSGSEEEDEETMKERRALVNTLIRDLKAYQISLTQHALKDSRIHHLPPLPSLLPRILIRLLLTLILALLALPGLLLWTPIFLATQFAVQRMLTRAKKRRSKEWDTWDEIAQTKLVWGLASGAVVYLLTVLATIPLLIAPLTAVVVPGWMWISLRWYEDAVAGARSLLSLGRLLWMEASTTGRKQLATLRAQRSSIHARLMTWATVSLGLPADPEAFFASVHAFTSSSDDDKVSSYWWPQAARAREEKGRVRGRWEGKVKYFSVKRRRKRDWEEVLRLDGYGGRAYPDEKLDD